MPVKMTMMISNLKTCQIKPLKLVQILKLVQVCNHSKLVQVCNLNELSHSKLVQVCNLNELILSKLSFRLQT